MAKGNYKKILAAFGAKQIDNMTLAYVSGDSAIEVYHHLRCNSIEFCWTSNAQYIQRIKDLALYEAIETKSVEDLLYFLGVGADCTEKLCGGQTAMQYVRSLITQGQQVDPAALITETIMRQAYLQTVILQEKYSLIPLALTYSPSTNFCFQDGHSILDKIKDKVSDTLFHTITDHMLCEAMQKGYGNFFNHALFHGGNVNAIIDTGQTLTDYALTHRVHFAFVDYMIGHGGIYNQINLENYKKQMLVDGIGYGSCFLVKYAASRLDVNSLFVDKTRITDFALEQKTSLAIIDCLADHGGIFTFGKLLAYYDDLMKGAIQSNNEDLLLEVNIRKANLIETDSPTRKDPELDANFNISEEEEVAAIKELQGILSGKAHQQNHLTSSKVEFVGDNISDMEFGTDYDG